MTTSNLTAVACVECGRLFRIINNRHLASHGLTPNEYLVRHPGASLVSEEVRAGMAARAMVRAEESRGKPRSEKDLAAIREAVARRPSRKGISLPQPRSAEHSRKISEAKRLAFAEGRSIPTQSGKPLREDTKAKISASLTGRKIPPEVTAKTIATKRERGFDFAFFRGRQHSPETREKIGEKSREFFARSRNARRAHMADKMKEAGVTFTGSLSDEWFHIRCDTCGQDFRRRPQRFFPSKWSPELCARCYPYSQSVAETELADWVENVNNGSGVTRSDRIVLAPLELDIFLPEKNLAIEYCGLYWHSELAGKARFYHHQKRAECEKRGIRLVTIFEDEWINKRDVVEASIRRLLGATPDRLDARKADVVKLVPEEANTFLSAHHMQGRGRASIHLGLRIAGDLVAVMTFIKGEVSRKGAGWEINRFCTVPNAVVRGAAGRLFQAFIREVDPASVTSYADLRWGTGDVYKAIGFHALGDTVPGYWYFRPNDLKRVHRFALRKRDDEPKTVAEWELRQAEGWNRIWDCGHRKWVWEKAAVVP